MTFEVSSIIDLPLEMLNYLCTYLTWVDIAVLELAIPNLRVQQCEVHHDFKLKKLEHLMKHFKKLKQKQYKYLDRFKFCMYMLRFKSNFCLQFHMNKAISVIRKDES